MDLKEIGIQYSRTIRTPFELQNTCTYDIRIKKKKKKEKSAILMILIN